MSEKLAVFMPSWVGDAVMATPALRALHSQQASQRLIVGVMQAAIAEVLHGVPWLSEELVYRKRTWSDRLRLMGRLRALRPDTVVLLTNSWWTGLAAWYSGAKQRLGYARDGRRWLLTDSLPVLKKDGKFSAVPAVDYYLQLVERLGCDISNRRMELSVRAEDEGRADELYRVIGFNHSRPLVVINSSGAWGAAKIWPADHVELLARRIVDSQPWQVLLHCGPGEREAADAVASRISHPRVQSMGRVTQLPLGLTKAVLARADVVVSTDSGPRHIAVALNRPVVGLYGPTDPAWTRTYNVPEVEVGVELSCRGCWQKSCPLQHHRCMRDLGVETVYGAVLSAYLHHQQVRRAG